MKETIGGKMFNTETATCVACYQYSEPRDVMYYREELYRKKTGEYFLYCKGGGLSPYRLYTPENSWVGREEIQPITLDEAKEWAEEHLDAEDYVTVFGEPEE